MSGSINWIDLLFIGFICAITVLGVLVNFIEPYLPVFIAQTFRYGKHSHKGPPSRLAQLSELPKSSFRHFYVFALGWATFWAYMVVHVYVGGLHAPDSVLWLLDALCGTGRTVRTNATVTFIAVLLLFVQCVRRFYETHFVQIFSTTSRINLSHYAVGYLHYFGAFLAIVSQAHGFVRPPPPSAWPPAAGQHQLHHPRLQWADCGLLHWLAVAAFLYAWYQQFEANLILSNLRRNETGSVVTQRHLMPVGGYFELVSSPHMLFEVAMYAALYALLHTSSTWLFVLCWVLTNQIENAWLTHKWYHETFVDYPQKRRAIFPVFL